MIYDLPPISLPETMTRLCGFTHSNSRRGYSQLLDIIESDQFLNLYVKMAFKEYLDKAGIPGMLNALGWRGFRDRVAEAYLYHAMYGRFPEAIELNEVDYVLDLEKRFDFLNTESNSRVFMLGMYLKLCEIYFERNGIFPDESLNHIPPEVDEILIKGKSKPQTPDWLIVIVWSLTQVMGAEKAATTLLQSKGKMNQILLELKQDQYGHVLRSLLRYGFAIQDSQFFIEERV